MKRITIYLSLLAVLLLAAGSATKNTHADSSMSEGEPGIKSMSALTFGPDGVLFVGDGKSGAVFALETGDTKARSADEEVKGVKNIEAKLAARLGTDASEIMIHDMAANPISGNIYFSVSRGRGKWDSRWQLPNHLDDADILVKVAPLDGRIDVVSTDRIRFARVDLPNPISPEKKHPWMKELSLRTDAVSDLVYQNGTLYVAGLSNEEFASTLWKVSYPFSKEVSATTLEIYHGAHGEFETHAPIRAFLPYNLNGEDHLLAAYLCTPLVTFKSSSLKDGQHVKGRTVAEFGSGNYPLDMVTYKKEGKEKLLIANSNLPFMIVDPGEVASYKGSITEEVKGYVAGVTYEPRSGTGITQMDTFNEKYLLALQRLPGGSMDMVFLDVRRF